MPKFIDFSELKQRVSITQVLDMLGIAGLKKHGEQLIGPCPLCKGSKSSFKVTPSKQVWNTFCGCGGGDIIMLVARFRSYGTDNEARKRAAHDIASHFKIGQQPSVPAPAREVELVNGEVGKPLDYLVPDHEALEVFDTITSADTYRHFGAGYAPKGVLSGRLLLPLHELDGTYVRNEKGYVQYVGVALTPDQEPRYKFAKDVGPSTVLFNAHRVGEGELVVVSDPLRVLSAHEAGWENVVATFSEHVSPAQLRLLAQLMEKTGCTVSLENMFV